MKLNMKTVLLCTSVLHTLQYSMMLPALVEAVIHLCGERSSVYDPDSNEQIPDSVLSKASFYMGIISATNSILLFFMNPLIGSISDSFGRYKCMLYSILGLILECFLLGLLPSLEIVIIASGIIRGVSDVYFTLAFCTMTDLVDAKDFPIEFGKLGASMGFGLMLGPSIGGGLSTIDPFLPFLVAGAIGAINLTFFSMNAKETLIRTNGIRQPFHIRNANPLTAFKLFNRSSYILILSVSFLLANMAYSFLSCWILYTSQEFNWGALANGIFLSMFGLCTVIMQGFFMKPFLKRYGSQKLTYFSSLMMFSSLMGYAFSPYGWLLPIIMVICSPGLLVLPAIRSMISKQVEGEHKGRLQGGLGALTTIAHAIAPPMVTSSFGYFISKDAIIYFPGFPMFLCSMFELIVAFTSYKAFQVMPVEEHINSSDIDTLSLKRFGRRSLAHRGVIESDFYQGEEIFPADVYHPEEIDEIELREVSLDDDNDNDML